MKTIKNTQAKTLLDEITINWLKKEANKFQKYIFDKKQYVDTGYCCSLTFLKSRELVQLQVKNSFFAPLPEYKVSTRITSLYREIRIHQLDQIRRSAVQFLNTSGGYIYFGIEPSKKNKTTGEFRGLALTEGDRANFLKTLLRNIVNCIFPTEGEDEE